ncbi:hypothetical protein ONS95_008350 [Cadophora gregata]|uniref:uncharacterized protein n=1 Tax=Cadophora gregata TaxID=51156 RepID=UPI0026DA7795|nr:uncharacterized protein ONS95_008350 [Cadophora gregata]KAK0100395.1 hypothetical protein ONS96_007676 [Cadophora gregata f. sp. sojae]KAK0126769.1 hypothetical protein ONS95_008350 [Cadophora gregata]
MTHPSIFIPSQTMDSIPFEWNVFEQQFFTWHQHLDTTLSSTNLSTPSSIPSTTEPPASYAHSSSSSSRGANSPTTGEQALDLDLDLPIKNDPKSKKAPTRRRIQNRQAQRAFRLRQKMHVESLQERLKYLVGAYEELRRRYVFLSGEYERMVSVGVGVGVGVERIGGLEGGRNGSVVGSDSVGGKFKGWWGTGEQVDGGDEGLEDCDGEEVELEGSVDVEIDFQTEPGRKSGLDVDKAIPPPMVVDGYQQQHDSVVELKSVCLHGMLASDLWVG